MLWSRKAVQEFMPILNVWASKVNRSEDFLVPILFEHANITSYKGDTRFIMGHGFHPYYPSIEYDFTKLQLPMCPKTDDDWNIIGVPSHPKMPKPTCSREIGKLNEVAFYHAAGNLKMSSRMKQFKAIQNAPDDVKVFSNGLWEYLCRDNGSKEMLYSLNYSHHSGPTDKVKNKIDPTLHVIQNPDICPPILQPH